MDKVGLPLDKAIRLRLGRQVEARKAIHEHVAFTKAAASADAVTIREQSCTTRLCGQNAVEIAFPPGTTIDVTALAERWGGQGEVSVVAGVGRIEQGKLELVVYPTGSVLVRGTKDRDKAMAMFDALVKPHDVFGTPGR